MLKCRLHFARHFALIFEKHINNLLTSVLGPSIIKKESADAYDYSYEKVKRWGRQWQHKIISALTKHVQGVQKQQSNLATLGEAGIRLFFHQSMNLYSLKFVFHVLASDVDLDQIFTSPLCDLYCTMYTNMCYYVWHAEVKNASGIKQEDEKALFERFRLLARERAFNNVHVSDIPRPPPKPVSKKRTKIGQLTPLSSTDTQFRVFGLPPAALLPTTSYSGQPNTGNAHVQPNTGNAQPGTNLSCPVPTGYQQQQVSNQPPKQQNTRTKSQQRLRNSTQQGTQPFQEDEELDDDKYSKFNSSQRRDFTQKNDTDSQYQNHIEPKTQSQDTIDRHWVPNTQSLSTLNPLVLRFSTLNP